MRLHSTRKQTENLRSFSSFSRSSAHNIARKTLIPMRASGILFAGIAATAGVSTLAFALQHGSKPSDMQAPLIHATQTTAPASVSGGSSASITIESSQQSAPITDDQSTPAPAISGQATINNETIPLTEGTVERNFTDSNGTEHNVTISLDGNSTTVQSDSSTTDIYISSSSTSNGTNTTRGSPSH